MIVLATLIAAAIEYRAPAPRLNPQICANVHRTGPGYIVMRETWVLPRLKLTEGRRLMPHGPDGLTIAGPSDRRIDRKNLRGPF
ncbi:hypothetical protein [Bradyrhizobium stylosanthis]|uniref:hypothetical protein n=1 Tax=Bradyrhizobium stylosanthis TaxID=1803665 RepID=UPI0007C54B2B|nr:hypothetical protein [Bradyrhizobium stylosanthis]